MENFMVDGSIYIKRILGIFLTVVSGGCGGLLVVLMIREESSIQGYIVDIYPGAQPFLQFLVPVTKLQFKIFQNTQKKWS